MNEMEHNAVRVFDEVIRTLAVKDAELRSLRATSRAFFSMVEHIRQSGAQGNTSSRLNLHYLNYALMRRLYPDEGSQLISLAIHRAARVLKGEDPLTDDLLFDLDRNLAAFVRHDKRLVLSVRAHGGRLYLPVDIQAASGLLKECLHSGALPKLVTGSLLQSVASDVDAGLIVRARWSCQAPSGEGRCGADMLEVAA